MIEPLISNDSYLYSIHSRDLQWTDPRLLKKYAMVSKQQQQYKKSLTVPYVNKTENNTGADELSDEEGAELLFQQRNNKILFKCLYYFCTTSVSFIGSMCGITFITVLLWKILDENLLNFRLANPPQQHLFFTRLFMSLTGGIVHVLSTILGKIGRLLTMSTNEVFTKDENAGWFSSFVRR